MAGQTGAFDKPIAEIIPRRCSWRSYSDRVVEDAQKQILRTFMDGLGAPPFGSRVRMILTDEPSAMAGIKGTYGISRGARLFLVGAVEEGPRAMEDFGHHFEQVILKATELGLGTCWMGGTFNQTFFARRIGLKPGEAMPIVSPVGYRAARPHTIDSLLRLSTGARQRKPWQDLFFRGNTPLDMAAAGPLAQPLEMVRLAPSASNLQPWRLVVDGDAVHFFFQRSRALTFFLGPDLQRIDMGIAMCHFALSARENGLTGRWESRTPPMQPPERSEYCISWVGNA